MAKHWTKSEKQILSNNIGNGMLVSDMCKLIPNHPESGIIRIAQTLNFGIKTKNGVMKFYANKTTRNRTKKNVKSATIVGAKRATTNNSAPITSVRTNQNLSDVIVPQKNGIKAYIAVYENFSTLIMSGNYTSVEISVITSNGVKVTVSKENS